VLHTIRWRLIASSLLAIGIPLIAFTFFVASLLWRFYLGELERDLQTRAHVIADSVTPALSPSSTGNTLALSPIIDRWRRYSDMRVTVVDRQGIIRAATLQEDVGTPLDEKRRPGLRAALGGQTNSTVWKNPRFGYEDTMYVNVPVQRAGRGVGAVRVAYTLTQVQQSVRRIQVTLLAAVTAYGGVIILLTLWLAGTMARPLETLTRGAQRLAAGELDHRVRIEGTREVTQLAATLNQMTERLQRLEGMRKQYVSNVSHELRTPLAAIRAMAETLLEHGESDPALRDRYLPRIISQTERLARLASQLLDLAQIESGDLVSSFAPVPLASVVDEVVNTSAGEAAAKGIRLTTDIPDTLPPVCGDRDRLVQVFLNLVDNAIRHTPSGGGVKVAAHRQGDRLAVSMTDTGQGIASEHLPHIFERFYRVDPARTRQSGGTGLGLSIVRQIVEAHGGTIEVTSAVNEGTCFTVVLPVAEAAIESHQRMGEIRDGTNTDCRR
jgi:signal transduction histidine kinase